MSFVSHKPDLEDPDILGNPIKMLRYTLAVSFCLIHGSMQQGFLLVTEPRHRFSLPYGNAAQPYTC